MHTRYILLCILLIAAGLRGYHLDYDLPEIYEEATPMRQAWEMWNWGDEGFDFNPHFFNYPALTFYIHFIIQALYLGLNLLVGRVESPADLFTRFNRDPTEIVLLARLVTILFGLGLVWAVYRLGNEIASPQTGLIAAATMAVLPLSVHTSRTILVDTPLVFFATLALIECVRLYKNHPRDLQCGLFIGLAAACKYTGALLILPYLIAQLFHKPINVRAIGFGIATCGITFLLVSPYCLLDFSAFWRDFSFERTHMVYGHFGVSASPAQYVYNLWSNFGVAIIAILASTFVLHSNLQNHRQWLPLILFMLIYIGTISTWSMKASHYLLPIFPILALLTAYGISILARRIHPPKIVLGILTALILLPAGAQTIQTLDNQTQLSTRALAKMWIHGHIPMQSRIAKEPYTPDLDKARFYIAHLPMDVINPKIVSPFYNLEWYTDFNYIMTSAGISERYRSNPTEFVPQNRFYDDLQKTWTLAAKFIGPNLNGPEIRIYKNPRELPKPDVYPPAIYTTLEGAPIAVARDLLAQLARLYRDSGWHPKAIDIYQHLLVITPDHPDFYAELATSYYALEFHEQAIVAYEYALQQDSTNVAILTNLGTVHFHENNLTKAAIFWERAQKQESANLDIVNNLVFLYRRQNRPDRAIELLKKAQKHHPDNTDIQSTLDALTQ